MDRIKRLAPVGAFRRGGNSGFQRDSKVRFPPLVTLWRHSYSIAICLALLAAAPPQAIAADGDLTGLNEVKFGMSVKQVVAALGDRCKPEILKNDAGGEFLERGKQCAEPNVEPKALSTKFERARYYFDQDRLSRIVLIHESGFGIVRKTSTLEVVGHLEKIYGSLDEGSSQCVYKDDQNRRLKGDLCEGPVSHLGSSMFDNNGRKIFVQYERLSAGQITFNNGGRITTTQYEWGGRHDACESWDAIIIDCEHDLHFTGIEFAHSVSDSLVLTDELHEIIDQFESSPFGWSLIGRRLQSIFSPVP